MHSQIFVEAIVGCFYQCFIFAEVEKNTENLVRLSANKEMTQNTEKFAF